MKTDWKYGHSIACQYSYYPATGGLIVSVDSVLLDSLLTNVDEPIIEQTFEVNMVIYETLTSVVRG